MATAVMNSTTNKNYKAVYWGIAVAVVILAFVWNMRSTEQNAIDNSSMPTSHMQSPTSSANDAITDANGVNRTTSTKGITGTTTDRLDTKNTKDRTGTKRRESPDTNPTAPARADN